MTTTQTSRDVEVTVPEIGDFNAIPVIEIHIAEGDQVALDDPLVTLESDKATMDVPSPAAGTVKRLAVNLGDEVSVGSLILVLASGADDDSTVANKSAAGQQSADLLQQELSPSAAQQVQAAAQQSAASTPTVATDGTSTLPVASAPGSGLPHAGPSVRRLARELDIDLSTVTGTGEKGRISKEDLLARLRPAAPAAPAAAPQGAGIPPVPVPDFTKFGPVETVALSRIKRISGTFLHRSWLNVPHVTHNDEADITELDGYRREVDTEAKPQGYRVTLLSFLIKAAVSTLRAFPEVNSSLTADQEGLTLKSYYNIGVAVDTPNGLVVPVIRDADRKGVTALSKELGELSGKARAGQLAAADMQGGTFTISSLGGIGGTSFTPIVNAPEVAILGVVRSKTAPVWDGSSFQPRLMLPISLSYDHRVIDGAMAARFSRHLCGLLEDTRRLIL